MTPSPKHKACTFSWGLLNDKSSQLFKIPVSCFRRHGCPPKPPQSQCCCNMHCRPRGPFPDKSSQPGGRPDRGNIDIRGSGGGIIKVCAFVAQLFGLPVSSCYGCELLSVTCLGFDLALLFFWFPPLRGARCPQSRARPPGGGAKAAEGSNPQCAR